MSDRDQIIRGYMDDTQHLAKTPVDRLELRKWAEDHADKMLAKDD